MLRSLALAALLAIAPAAVEARQPAAAPVAEAQVALSLAEQAADWQLAKLRAGITATDIRTPDPAGWVQAAFWLGLTELAERSPSPRFTEAIAAQGAALNYRLGARPLHADDHAIGQTWLWLHARNKDPRTIAPLKAQFDAILADPPRNDLVFGGTFEDRSERACQTRWCWSDALFMAPPAFVGLSQATGDARYQAYSDKEFVAATKHLFDEEEGLYFRDDRFLTHRDERGRKVFWSRGNGWVFAGLAQILERLPAGHPSRAEYERVYLKMAKAVARTQKPDGFWAPSLISPEGSPPEASGTGFFVYGLAWGVEHGVLDPTTYRPVVDRGWAALKTTVHPDGKVGWVQQIGFAPDHVTFDDTQFYGVGAFILAASAVYDLNR
jgi:rhamnogalacturonyl hydrolase YesR